MNMCIIYILYLAGRGKGIHDALYAFTAPNDEEAGKVAAANSNGCIATLHRVVQNLRVNKFNFPAILDPCELPENVLSALGFKRLLFTQNLLKALIPTSGSGNDLRYLIIVDEVSGQTKKRKTPRAYVIDVPNGGMATSAILSYLDDKLGSSIKYIGHIASGLIVEEVTIPNKSIPLTEEIDLIQVTPGNMLFIFQENKLEGPVLQQKPIYSDSSSRREKAVAPKPRLGRPPEKLGRQGGFESRRGEVLIAPDPNRVIEKVIIPVPEPDDIVYVFPGEYISGGKKERWDGGLMQVKTVHEHDSNGEKVHSLEMYDVEDRLNWEQYLWSNQTSLELRFDNVYACREKEILLRRKGLLNSN